MRYLTKSPADRAAMLQAIGIRSVDDLFSPIPAEFRLTRDLAIPRSTKRARLKQALQRLTDGFEVISLSAAAGNSASGSVTVTSASSITELVCSNPYGTDVRCRTAVNWELYDRKHKVVIYKALTRATAAGGSGAEIGHALVTGALRSLLSRARFVDSVRKPKESNDTNPRPFLSFRSCSDLVRMMPSEAEPVLNGVVVVEVGNFLGSGVLLSPDGLVLTAAHVVDTEGEISILERSGTQTRAHVVRFNRQVDVALLAPEGSSDTSCLPIRNTSIRVGEDLYAVGSPASRDLSFSLTRGIVSGARQIDGVPLIQTDASISPGNSGGPLLDAGGAAIGIITATASDAQGVGFAIPINQAKQLLADARK